MANVIHGSTLLDLLANALEIDGRQIKRIVIDIPFDDAVNVYIERFGDTKLLDVNWPNLSENVVRLIDANS